MPRKLIHSLRALAVTFGVFAACLGIGTTTNIQAPQESHAPLAQASATRQLTPAPAVKAKPSVNKQRVRRREAREELAMPFFSFAHGLRRGNGS